MPFDGEIEVREAESAIRFIDEARKSSRVSFARCGVRPVVGPVQRAEPNRPGWVKPSFNSTFAICQVYSGEYADASGTVIEDFVSGGGVIDRVSGAFESTIELQFIRAWRISVWRNPDDASRSSNQLDQNVITTRLVTSGFNYSLVGSNPPGWRLDLENLDLEIPAGRVWIGLAAVAPTHFHQVYVLSNTSAQNRGDGEPFNSVGVSPGGFWGATRFSVNSDAAYAVNVVPEPVSFVICGLGLLLLRRRRQP